MRRLCIALVLAALPVAIFASTVTTTLTVGANVLAAGTCSVTNAMVWFGDLTPPITANIDSGTSYGVTCPSGTPYSIALSAGGSGNQLARKMLLSGGTLTDVMYYNIYTDSTYTTVWGDGSGGTGVMTGTGNGAQQALAVYGRVPAQSTPPPGSYGDTLTITVTY